MKYENIFHLGGQNYYAEQNKICLQVMGTFKNAEKFARQLKNTYICHKERKNNKSNAYETLIETFTIKSVSFYSCS